MNTRELRELKTEELIKRMEKVQNELKEVEFDIKVGQEPNYAQRGKKKKELARIKTIVVEMEKGINKDLVQKVEKKIKKKEEKVQKENVKEEKDGDNKKEVTKDEKKEKSKTINKEK